MENNYNHGDDPQRAYFKLHLACMRDFKLTPRRKMRSSLFWDVTQILGLLRPLKRNQKVVLKRW
jgi:hypothetical protein